MVVTSRASHALLFGFLVKPVLSAIRLLWLRNVCIESQHFRLCSPVKVMNTAYLIGHLSNTPFLSAEVSKRKDDLKGMVSNSNNGI